MPRMRINGWRARATRWRELLALVDAGKPLPHFPLVPSLRARVKVERRQVESQTVVASRPGSDEALKNEYVAGEA